MAKKKESKIRAASISLKTKLLLITGLLLLLVPTVFRIHQTVQLMLVVPKVPVVVKKTAVPIHIALPSINIALPIEETHITNNTWTIAEKSVSHLATAANPGENGPIILYAHNTNDRFGPIRWLSKGKEIVIATTDKKRHIYTVTETRIVDPKQTNIFFERKSETLYLFTCDGFADLKRFIVIAIPRKQ